MRTRPKGLEDSIGESAIFWDILIQLLEDGQVIPVVGQDLLTAVGANSTTGFYKYLAEKLALMLGVSSQGLADGEELNEVACRYISEGNRVEDIYPALKTIISRAEATLPIPEPLVKLSQIRPLNLFVTTTCDSFLTRALNQVRLNGRSATWVGGYSPFEFDDLPRELARDTPYVYHLMGRASAVPSYAVTQEDFVEFFHSLHSETRCPVRLFDELNHRSLLILGCRFGGWLTRFLMRLSKRQRLSAGGMNDYVADSGVTSDKNLVLFLRNFSRSTKVYSSGSVLEFVNELHARWGALHPYDSPTELTPAPLTAARKSSGEGSVFLSYASEDAVVVDKIRAALEAVGVDVFFDRDDLQLGDDWEAKLRRTIRQCSLFMPIISRQTLVSGRRFFRVEWNLAVEESQMASFSDEEAFLVPVVIDDTSLTEANVPSRFRKVQWLSLPGGQPTSDLVSRIQQLYRKYQKSRVMPA